MRIPPWINLIPFLWCQLQASLVINEPSDKINLVESSYDKLYKALSSTTELNEVIGLLPAEYYIPSNSENFINDLSEKIKNLQALVGKVEGSSLMSKGTDTMKVIFKRMWHRFVVLMRISLVTLRLGNLETIPRTMNLVNILINIKEDMFQIAKKVQISKKSTLLFYSFFNEFLLNASDLIPSENETFIDPALRLDLILLDDALIDALFTFGYQLVDLARDFHLCDFFMALGKHTKISVGVERIEETIFKLLPVFYRHNLVQLVDKPMISFRLYKIFMSFNFNENKDEEGEVKEDEQQPQTKKKRNRKSHPKRAMKTLLPETTKHFKQYNIIFDLFGLPKTSISLEDSIIKYSNANSRTEAMAFENLFKIESNPFVLRSSFTSFNGIIDCVVLELQSNDSVNGGNVQVLLDQFTDFEALLSYFLILITDMREGNVVIEDVNELKVKVLEIITDYGKFLEEQVKPSIKALGGRTAMIIFQKSSRLIKLINEAKQEHGKIGDIRDSDSQRMYRIIEAIRVYMGQGQGIKALLALKSSLHTLKRKKIKNSAIFDYLETNIYPALKNFITECQLDFFLNELQRYAKLGLISSNLLRNILDSFKNFDNTIDSVLKMIQLARSANESESLQTGSITCKISRILYSIVIEKQIYYKETLTMLVRTMKSSLE